MAAACSLAQVSASALPLRDTTMTGLPVAPSASSNCCCAAGRSILVRSPPLKPSILIGISSPSSCGESPTKATTTSDAFAAATASSICACAGASQFKVTPPPDRSPEWLYSSRKSCGLVSVKLTSTLAGFEFDMEGGALAGAPVGFVFGLPLLRSPSESTLPSSTNRYVSLGEYGKADPGSTVKTYLPVAGTRIVPDQRTE